jgi:hypothetical protein
MLFDYSNGQILTINPSKNLIKYTHSVNNNTSCHLIHDLKKKYIYCIGVLTSGYVGSCEKPENPENYTHPHVCILFRLIQQQVYFLFVHDWVIFRVVIPDSRQTFKPGETFIHAIRLSPGLFLIVWNLWNKWDLNYLMNFIKWIKIYR